MTDPNGVTTDTVNDDFDRVRFLIQRGAIPEEDLVTEYVYNAFGDLFQTILPEGNVIEYGYDHAGRLIRIEQKPDADPASLTRTVDELDRVTFVDYPDAVLDVTYTYDDPAVAFSLGRLTEILRDGHAVDYEYDRFGRVTRDGELTYVYDDNGNLLDIGYPGGVKAHYTYDFADRQATLDVEQPGEPLQAIVIFASYYPSGPLKLLIFSSG